jgi:hypothetical protein
MGIVGGKVGVNPREESMVSTIGCPGNEARHAVQENKSRAQTEKVWALLLETTSGCVMRTLPL